MMKRFKCKFKRKLSQTTLPFTSCLYRITRRFREKRSRIGIYASYYNSSKYFDTHLKCLLKNTSNNFDYYVFKNFTKSSEADEFDKITEKYDFVNVFKPIAGDFPCPLRHADALQRMVSLTDNEVIVLLDIDMYVIGPGWDKFILKELEVKELVSVIVNFENRTAVGQIPLVAHPSFMAFRRNFLEENKLDLLDGEGNDPAYKITKFLMRSGRFNTETITPLLPTHVEFPNGYFPDNMIFACPIKVSHGFCTQYGKMLFHFWHSMNYADGKDIIADDGTLLVPHEVVAQRVNHFNDKFGA